MLALSTGGRDRSRHNGYEGKEEVDAVTDSELKTYRAESGLVHRSEQVISFDNCHRRRHGGDLLWGWCL